MSAYLSALCKAMEMLAEQPRAVFMGQAVAYPGTGMYETLKGVSMEKRVELPVAEEMQLGMAIGASLNGDLPISLYPRMNFLLLAANQLVNHLDKIPLYSGYRPKVIIRTAIATDHPLNPGVQHLGDFSLAFQSMLKTVRVVVLDRADLIVPEYEYAAKQFEGSTIIVERMDLYNA